MHDLEYSLTLSNLSMIVVQLPSFWLEIRSLDPHLNTPAPRSLTAAGLTHNGVLLPIQSAKGICECVYLVGRSEDSAQDEFLLANNCLAGGGAG
jgi:hypothetical protein